jgi:hypothetical protein
MYKDEEFSGSKKALGWFIALYCAFTALLLGLFIYSLVARVEWLAYVSIAILVLETLFLWGNFGGRLVAWRRFLRDMQAGLEREATGVIASIDDEEAFREGLEFRAMRLMTGDETDKAGGRLLYVDVSRFPLPAGPGQRVRCKLFGNYVKDITVLEEN